MKDNRDNREKGDDAPEPAHVPEKPVWPTTPAREALGWQEAESGRALAGIPITDERTKPE